MVFGVQNIPQMGTLFFLVLLTKLSDFGTQEQEKNQSALGLIQIIFIGFATIPSERS